MARFIVLSTSGFNAASWRELTKKPGAAECRHQCRVNNQRQAAAGAMDYLTVT